MKKVSQFVRSMKFGMILLGLILALSLIGSMITQGETEEYYRTTYSMGQWILTFGLDDIYHSGYFLGIGILLILNLTMCSLVRFKSLLGAGKRQVKAALKVNAGKCLESSEINKIEKYLQQKHYHRKAESAVTVYYKNQIGHIGSFLVHLSLVLILLLGALVLYTGTSTLVSVMYGEDTVLEDGTRIHLEDFVTQDETGNTHYESTLTITTPEGEQITDAASVNYPINYRGKKYFQETYGYTVHVQIYNTETGVGDEMYLTEQVFLQTSDSGAGIYYMTAYTDYEMDENGQMEILSDTIEDGKPAAFLIYTTDGTETGMETGVVTEGTTIQVEAIQFTFVELCPYPGIRVKETSRVLMGLLYSSFGLMIVGLWFCFFQQPVYVTVGKSGKSGYYHISGLRNTEGLENELQEYLQEK